MPPPSGFTSRPDQAALAKKPSVPPPVGTPQKTQASALPRRPEQGQLGLTASVPNAALAPTARNVSAARGVGSRPLVAKSGSVVSHPKYGRGTVLRREGDGDDAKLTVSFPGYGLKKIVEKYAGIKIEE